MSRAKWLSVILCACLLLSPQSVIFANRVDPQVELPNGLDRMRQMIIENPGGGFAPAPEPGQALQAETLTLPTWAKVVLQTYRNSQWDLYLANPDGSNEVRLTSESSSEVYPSLAKGGGRLVFASNRRGNYDLYVQDIPDGEAKILYTSTENDTYPVWSPDGSRVAFQSYRTGNYEIYVIQADGSNLVQLTNNSEYDGEPSWSPDGSQMAFVSKRNGLYEIWVMNADGSNPRLLTSYSTTATPAWSPRGDLIAYANDRNSDGYYELWVMNADGSNPVAIRNYRYSYEYADDWAPAWSPDGNFFSYISTRQDTYGWTESAAGQYDPYHQQYAGGLPQDRRLMRLAWASTDVTPPAPCVISVAPDQSADSFLANWSAADAESGAAYYQIQSRRLPDGNWQDALAENSRSGGVLSGAHGDQLEFRCRARDLSGNQGDWSTPPLASTAIHSLRPTSTLAVSQRYIKGGQTVDVRWAGKGMAGVTLRYDIFVRDGSGGDWTLWQDGVSTTSAKFSGISGHTYYFRSQARDSANHIQVWQPDPQAVVSFYAATLSVWATDTRGNPLGAPTLALNPPAILEESGPAHREKRLGVGAGALKLAAAPAGFGAVAETTLNVPQDRTFTLVLPPADNLITNGGFEAATLNDWTLTGEGVSLSPTQFHTGQASAKITPGSTGSSQFSQSVTIPAALQKPTLSFLYYFPNNLYASPLTVEVEGTSLQTVLSTTHSTTGWTHVWADLSAMSGQTVTLRFRLSTWASTAYIDEISLGSWKTPAVQSVTPAQWQGGNIQKITLTGQNFSGTPQVFLNQTPLNNVKRLNAGQLTAETPAGMRGGTYTLRVVDADGIEAILPAPIILSPQSTFLPLVAASGTPQAALQVPDPVAPSDWTTFGKDEAHTSFVANDAGASRYSRIWSVNPLNFEYSGDTAQVVSADGIALVFQRSNINAGIFAYDISSANLLWKYQVNSPGIFGPASIANGKVYFFAAAYNLTQRFLCLDLYSGNVIWTQPWSDPRSQSADQAIAELGNSMETYHPQVFGQSVYLYIYNGAGSEVIFNAANGEMIQPYTQYANYAGGNAAYADGKVYSWLNGIFREYDPISGKTTWSLAPAWNQPGRYPTPVIVNRTAVLPSAAGLYGIDLDTHQVRWTIYGNYGANFPAAGGDRVYAIQGNLLEIRQLSDGALLGSFTAPAALIGSPLVAGEHIYVATADHTYILNRATLQVEWTADEGGWLSLSNGYLFIATSNTNISVYRAQER